MKLGRNPDLASLFMETWSIFGPSFIKLLKKLGPYLDQVSIKKETRSGLGLSFTELCKKALNLDLVLLFWR